MEILGIMWVKDDYFTNEKMNSFSTTNGEYITTRQSKKPTSTIQQNAHFIKWFSLLKKIKNQNKI